MTSSATGTAPTRYCQRCGKPLVLGARFCGACGTVIPSAVSDRIASANANARELFIKAIAESLAKNSAIPVIPVLQEAIKLGLTPQDEVHARLMMGGGYREIFGNSGLPAEKMIEATEFDQCMSVIESALDLDRTRSLGFFSEPLNIGRLRDLDEMYRLTAQVRQTQLGTDWAIAFLAAKLCRVEYLSRPPLLVSLLQLATLHWEQGTIEEARRCLSKVIHTEPLYPADKERNEDLHKTARQMLSAIQNTHH